MSQTVLDRPLPDMPLTDLADPTTSVADPTLPTTARTTTARTTTGLPATALPTTGLRRTRVDHPRRPTVDVAGPDEHRAGTGAPVAFRPTSGVALALAAARADAVHLAFSAQVPTVAAMAVLVDELEGEIAAVGRDRAEVRIVLDVDVLPTPDAAEARRKRSYLEHLDALAGLTWTPSATRLVAPAEAVVGAAVELAQRVGADGVVLVPLSASESVERLQTLAASR